MTAPSTDVASLATIRRALGDRYVLERELGRGGMGTVYLAREIKLDRPVALKVLSPEFATQVGLRDRFLRETRTAASFSHPNIVPVYAVEESDDLLAYAMGLVEGETLSERVARIGPVPVRELVRIMQDVGYALAYAHGRGVVHRDIKPDNIMLERATGRALVLDFGISRSMTQAVAGSATNLTRVGEVVGTPEYMSPEQASGDVVDGRSDLYSLGLTAYFGATGYPAITGDSTQKILVRQLTEPVPPVEEARPDLPPALAAVIDRCVKKDPAERFPTAEALVEALDAAQLAEREIPLPIRLFAGELSTLSFAVSAILIVTFLSVQAQVDNNMSTIDTWLPAVGLLAIAVARVLTTVSEVRRLAESGYSAADVNDGLQRVMAERVTRRNELRANERTRRRRRATLVRGVVMVVLAVVMVRLALATRVPIRPGHYATPTYGLVLVFIGFALLGAGLVLVMKSPFRMSPLERLYRIVWLGPFGRMFVRLSMAGAHAVGVTERGVVVPAPTPVRARPATEPSAIVTAPRGDPIAALEARVAELERWRRGD